METQCQTVYKRQTYLYWINSMAVNTLSGHLILHEPYQREGTIHITPEVNFLSKQFPNNSHILFDNLFTFCFTKV